MPISSYVYVGLPQPVCPSLRLFLSLPLAVSLSFLSLYISFSLSLSLATRSICPSGLSSVSLGLSLSVCHRLGHYQSLSQSFCDSLTPILSHSLSPLYLRTRVSVCLILAGAVRPCQSITVCLSVSLSLCLCVCRALFLLTGVCLDQFPCLYLCLLLLYLP